MLAATAVTVRGEVGRADGQLDRLQRPVRGEIGCVYDRLGGFVVFGRVLCAFGAGPGGHDPQ
jgi:hypothetical protein